MGRAGRGADRQDPRGTVHVVSGRLRIGMLLDRTFPPDPRVGNEARSLAAAGHEVHLLCLAHDGSRPAREEWQGVRLHRVWMPRWFYRKFSAVSLEVPFYRWALRNALRRLVAREGLEVIHTHDLPMVAIGLSVARARALPLVADLHENWPAALRTYGYARRLLGRLLISPQRWERHERAILPNADAIVTVIEEAAERIAGIGIPEERIEVVRNTVAVDEFRGFPIDASIAESLRGRFVVAYLGGFERHRGIETAVAAMARLRRILPDCLLLLVGGGSTEAALRGKVEALGLSGHVRFEGWQPFERFPSYILASSVCLIPHLKNAHTDTTIPHKLFHYMLLERPVVTTDCSPLKRIVEETGAGLVVRSGDEESLAAGIAALADSERRRAMGAAGRSAVEERYCWERDAERLIGLYDRIAAAGARGVHAS